MIAMEDLHPTMRPLVERFEALCEEAGLDVLIYCGLRSALQQARIWRRGRSTAKIHGALSSALGRAALLSRGVIEPTADEIQRGGLAEKFVPFRKYLGPETTAAATAARFLTWSGESIIEAGPQSGSTIATNAKPGYSAHQYGVAIDAIPVDAAGTPLWGDATAVARMGEFGEAANMDWAGRWTTFKERVHFQLPDWRTELLEA